MRKQFILVLILLFAYSTQAQILKKQIPDKVVVLTFDDATASQYSIVATLLKKYGFNATFFICEFPPNFSDTTKYMNWRQIKELDKMGFEIANHTKTHSKINQIPIGEFIEELNYIENKCDSMGICPPTSFAYPGYRLSLQIMETLKEKGYYLARAGGSRAYGPLTDHPQLIPSWATKPDNKEEIFQAFEKARNGEIVVLTIHGVPDIEHPWVNLPTELFEEYLEYLSVNKYKDLSLRDLEDYVDFKKAIESISPDINKKLRN